MRYIKKKTGALIHPMKNIATYDPNNNIHHVYRC